MAKKLYNIRAKTGHYEDKDGKDKNTYMDAGSIWPAREKGKGPSILIKRTLNLAALEPISEGSEYTRLYLFKPEDNDEKKDSKKDSEKKKSSKQYSRVDPDDEDAFKDDNDDDVEF